MTFACRFLPGAAFMLAVVSPTACLAEIPTGRAEDLESGRGHAPGVVAGYMVGALIDEIEMPRRDEDQLTSTSLRRDYEAAFIQKYDLEGAVAEGRSEGARGVFGTVEPPGGWPLGGPAILGGSDPSLVLPPAPRGLAGSYDNQSNSFCLEWLPAKEHLKPGLRHAVGRPLGPHHLLGGYSILEPDAHQATLKGYFETQDSLAPYSLRRSLSGFTVWTESGSLPSGGSPIVVDGCAFREATDPHSCTGCIRVGVCWLHRMRNRG